MSRFDPPSDDERDAFERGTRCATADCHGYVTFPAFEVWCSKCIIAHREMLARQDKLRESRAREMWRHGR